ncbi:MULTISPECIES: DUF397 domain-containing protein [Streptomyces]|uniref:DUF397 domain-containing protein n=1 Tax=Streptomyces TaxID=1883 RepID=UPI001E48195C|nr:MULTISPECIES: DUF397 domain-containing protein [Streptomyces]UFQ15831.1 DUF397 domain-containing protein [Streptomyces huasconensis]WCL85435.1 DUF397 domain-containing protein [Streptomyces sp. JCM 35825]
MNEEPNWHTSSYTKSDTCVEVADNLPKKVLVRDSKRRQGAFLDVPDSSWADFVEFSKDFQV